MKLRPVGIFAKDKRDIPTLKASDYGNKHYDGIELRTGKNGMPVVIMRSKKTAPLMWKVAYGYSQVFFRTFAEAVEFCNSRGMQIMKEQVDE